MKIALFSVVLIGFVAQSCFAKEVSELTADQSTAATFKSNVLSGGKVETLRVKRGYGHGGGGGGGGGHGGYGHGPGAGGGARGPVYFCGWVGSKMGSSGYGR